MSKLTVDKVWANDKDFNGNPYINKFTNQPEVKYTFVSEGAKFYAKGTPEQLASVRDGDTIEGVIEEKVSGAGKEYKVFSFPKPFNANESMLNDRLKGIENEITKLWSAITELSTSKVKEVELIEEEPDQTDLNDIPW
jgi:hypothetical protein